MHWPSLFLAAGLIFLPLACTTGPEGDNGTNGANGGNGTGNGGGDFDAGLPGSVDSGNDNGGGGDDAGAGMDAGPAPDSGLPPADAGAPPPDAGGNVGGDCNDADPLTNQGWAGFCGDRVDDNCTVEDTTDPCPESASVHNYCRTGDEPCPSTQPGSAAPDWDCTGTPPDNVIAYAHFTDGNEQVVSFCTFVYESTAVAGEFYAAIKLENGTNTSGPNNYCSADKTARRHLYYSNLDEGACPEVRYIHNYNPLYPVDQQLLSNECRKMIRNTQYNDPAFDPDIQYFASSRAEADAKLAILDTAEIACVGIDNIDGDPYRVGEIWVTQASQTLVLVPN
jgi:hypothetical protein